MADPNNVTSLPGDQTIPSPSWRVRDAAVALRDRRSSMRIATVAATAPATVTTTAPLGSVFPDASSLTLSSAIVCQALDGAAAAVLEAMDDKGTNNSSSSNNKATAPTMDPPDWRRDLPPALLAPDPLDALRSFALRRAYENKEYCKRKGGKTDVTFASTQQQQQDASNNAAAASSTNTPTKPSTSTTTKLPVKLKLKLSLSKKSLAAKSAVSSSSATAAATTTTNSPSTQPSSTSVSFSPTTTIPAATTSSTTIKKFTRNTPASSAAALDTRVTLARSMLCCAGNLVFGHLTPGDAIPPRTVPHWKDEKDNGNDDDKNNAEKDNDDDKKTTSMTQESEKKNKNMGAVLLQAQTLAQRTTSMVDNAVRRATRRAEQRRASTAAATTTLSLMDHPFGWSGNHNNNSDDCGDLVDDTDNDDEDDDTLLLHSKRTTVGDVAYRANPDALTATWRSVSLPRFLKVLYTGAGHAVYHDLQWSSRHGRLADVLRQLSTAQSADDGIDNTDSDDNTARRSSKRSPSLGPHLIITTKNELPLFQAEFQPFRPRLGRSLTDHNDTTATPPLLHALAYHGSPRRRRSLRRSVFPPAAAGCGVVLTSYTALLQDFLHFSQLPWETVIVDDGAAWMSAKDGNTSLGQIWDAALLSANDHHVGLAGSAWGNSSTTGSAKWDFRRDVTVQEHPDIVKDAWVGLTARHRILTASCFAAPSSSSSSFSTAPSPPLELIPVSRLVEFVAPHFAVVAKEEWDRSRVAQDADSMAHFRTLVARSVIVHSSGSTSTSMDVDSDDTEADDDNDNSTEMSTDPDILALQALMGKLPTPDRSDDAPVPSVLSDDEFVSSGKIAYSRRSSLKWLGSLRTSWLRYELGSVDFQPILSAMKLSNNHGHFCEEITTASSTTSSGATGQVAGTLAYRLAVRCGRHFGSEPGLRQHISAHHAPAGTWLCRTCSCDCISSQSRTFHERSCGQQQNGTPGDPGSSVGATPTVGQGGGKKAGVGKKKATRPGAALPSGGPASMIEKDPDGSFRVPAYRGVWVNKSGKYFVKVAGNKLTETPKTKKLLMFESAIDAAKKHDAELNKNTDQGAKKELNFKPDGSRIVYEDIAPPSTSGLGGSAANVVPALSVINIKDLPADVKPLLRDPRQTSRTGGNAKRHVYAYRGVCRQARKGHDRWQSQISFMGVNHYLGTFDSEWDAAAVYAWAHLILYGEEATRQAQKEGEEAAAAYEQEKKDIADGKIPEPSAKPEKKRKQPAKKEKKDGKEAPNGDGDAVPPTKKRKTKETSTTERKPRGTPTAAKGEKEAMAPILAKAVVKVPALAPRDAYRDWTDKDLMEAVARKITVTRNSGYTAGALLSISSADDFLRPCLPTRQRRPSVGVAMLLGLSASQFGWDLQDYVQSLQVGSEQDEMAALQLLAVEYDEDGANEHFSSIIQGTLCILGNASSKTQRTYNSLGLGAVPVGGSVGDIDCHVGGVPGSCSESAACIQFAPTDNSNFTFSCLSAADNVTLNGRRVTPDMGGLPLMHEDICCVGVRVFAFVLPSDRLKGP